MSTLTVVCETYAVCCLQACEHHGMLKSQELAGVVVAKSNTAVQHFLAQYYSVPLPLDLAEDCDPLAVAVLGDNSAQHQQQS